VKRLLGNSILAITVITLVCLFAYAGQEPAASPEDGKSINELKEELGLTYLFISHNLAVVDYMADRIAVMCSGMLVELATREALFSNPVHPYTRALLAAVPRADPSARLDLTLLMEGRASYPERWPEPYRIVHGEPGALEEVAPGHLVRVRRNRSAA